MATLSKTGKYSDINKIDTTRMEYYVIKFMSEAYTIQEETAYSGQISTSGELFAK